jgi:5-formyltetrahydrofolate cyclo-ligase
MVRCWHRPTHFHGPPQESFVPDFSDEAEVTGAAKSEMRIQVLARRRSMPPEVRAEAAGRMQVALAALVRRLRPHRVTAYVPVGREPGGPDLPEALAGALAAIRSDGRLLLPVLQPDLDLDWAVYGGFGSLIAAGRGMREPAGARLGRDAIRLAELVVVPALAVDRRGVRLGRGGGSYDRALARLGPGTLSVALVYDAEVVDELPATRHDVPVRAVITPEGGLRRLAPA